MTMRRIGDPLMALAARLDYVDETAVDRIRTLREIEAVARGTVTATINEARDEDASWADIAAALGTTRQAAWERYARTAQ